MGAIATDTRAPTSVIKSIQRGEVTFNFTELSSGATQAVSITSVDMSKSVVGLLSSLGLDRNHMMALSVRLTSSTELTFKQTGAASPSNLTLSYEVIEYV